MMDVNYFSIKLEKRKELNKSLLAAMNVLQNVKLNKKKITVNYLIYINNRICTQTHIC